MLRSLTLTLFALALSACSQLQLTEHFGKKIFSDKPPQSAPAITEQRKVGKPYQIFGQWYYPISTSDGFTERGIASWYGPGFHGNKTANGETYNKHDYTAAHPTLPLPTYVRVTNLQNGRSLVVRVNDRGPFARGRVIDLSYASAKALDMVGSGTAPVYVEAMPADGSPLGAVASQTVPANKTPTEPDTNFQTPPPATVPSAVQVEELAPITVSAPPGQVAQVDGVTIGHAKVFIQTGAFTDYQNALKQVSTLQAKFAAQLQEASVQGKTFYRVRIGPMADVASADTTLKNVVEAGFKDARLVIE